MRMYIGTVATIGSSFVIEFNIPGIYESEDCNPVAVPLSPLCRAVLVGSEVMIIQPDDMIEMYYYIPTATEDKEVRLQYGDSFISINENGEMKISAKKSIKITSPETTIDGTTISIKNGTAQGFSTGKGPTSTTIPQITGVAGLEFLNPGV